MSILYAETCEAQQRTSSIIFSSVVDGNMDFINFNEEQSLGLYMDTCQEGALTVFLVSYKRW